MSYLWNQGVTSNDWLNERSAYLRGLELAQTRFVARAKPTRPSLEEAEVAERLANSWLIGADPEFVCLEKGKIKDAKALGQAGELGYDHAGYVVEVRPEPARGAYSLVKRMQKILNSDKAKVIRQWKWRAGAWVPGRRDDGREWAGGHQPLGGHVHFDFPPGRQAADEAEDDFSEIIKSQDVVVQCLEKLDILPTSECAARRRHSEYGKLGSWRASNDERHMEYRSYPSWLFHPHTAFLTLTLAKLAAVSPEMVGEVLKAGSYKSLVEFVEAFKFKDANARRVCEKMLDGRGVKALQHDPDADMRETWKELRLGL